MSGTIVDKSGRTLSGLTTEASIGHSRPMGIVHRPHMLSYPSLDQVIIIDAALLAIASYAKFLSCLTYAVVRPPIP